MAPDSGEPDAAALRDRVDDLEQTVADQQATIESLEQPPASRRGVLAALTGVAGAGALGAYSQRASAQAAGQVGTSSEPVDVEAWDLTVQNGATLGGDLDAGGNSLTNVGAVETDNISLAPLGDRTISFGGGQTRDNPILPDDVSLSDAPFVASVFPDANPGNDVGFRVDSVWWDDSNSVIAVRVTETENAGGGDARVLLWGLGV